MAERRNDIRLWTEIDGELVSHYWLYEFESRATGLVCIHPTLPASMERVRLILCQDEREEVEVIVSCGTRTHEENVALAGRLGWTDDGGQVSRDSYHLPEHFGVAADFGARYKHRQFRPYDGVRSPGWLPQKQVGQAARQVFDYVKDDYADGHVHGDNRHGGLKLKTWRRINEAKTEGGDGI